MSMEIQQRTVSFSKTTITELMVPAYANFGGKIHGGILLSLMDKVAYACSSKHAGSYCVTVSVDTVDFLQPVEVGELVHLNASVNYVGNSSLVVGIKVIAENVKVGLVKHTNTSFFTMVAKGDDDQPVQVPSLVLETSDDVRRFSEALERRELRISYRKQVAATKASFDLQKQIKILDKHRCIINLTN